MFHTGSLRVHPDPEKDSSIFHFYQQVSPIFVWLSTPDVLLGVFFRRPGMGSPGVRGGILDLSDNEDVHVVAPDKNL